MQQVNLYTDAFRPKVIVLPLAHMLWGCAVLVLVLVLLSVWMYSSQAKLQAEADSAQEKLAALQTTLDEQNAKLSGMKTDESLVRHNDRLRNQLEGRSALLAMLDSVAISESERFSGYMIGLARHTQNELWLTRFSIDQGGEGLLLEGQTSHAKAVPAYLERLNQEDVFEGMNFSQFAVSKADAENRFLNFTLKTSEQVSAKGPLQSVALQRASLATEAQNNE